MVMCFIGNSRIPRQAGRLECLEVRSNHHQCLAWMREAGKTSCKRRYLAAPCSHVRERCRGRDSNTTFRLLLVILVVVYSYVSKVMSAEGLITLTIIAAPKRSVGLTPDNLVLFS